MSYNIDSFKLKKLINLRIPVKALYEHERSDWHPTPDIREIQFGEASIDICETTLSGIVAGGELVVMKIDISGEGSGTAVNWILEPALRQSQGELEAVCVWEGGDSINRLTVKDGELAWTDIEL